MSPGEHTAALFAGVLAVLAVASLIGFALTRSPAGNAPVVADLNARTRSWWIMVGVLGATFALGPAWVIALFALASFTALREFLTLTPTRSGDHRALVIAFFVVLPVQYLLVAVSWYGLFAIFIPVYTFLVLPIVAALGGDTTRFMRRVAELQWGLMISVFCLSHVPALLLIDIPGFEGRNILLIAFLILVVQSSDIFQYVAGKLFGRRRIAPTLSPSKTWEGFAAGVALSTLLAAALWWITPFTIFQAALMGLIIVLMGFLGGLVMSAIKRDRGVKDWGYLIAGHGGIFDRLDSVIFAAPVFFHLTRYVWAA